jgi:hypothetical protein
MKILITIAIISLLYGFSYSILQSKGLLENGITLILFVSYILIMIGVFYFLKIKKSV